VYIFYRKMGDKRNLSFMAPIERVKLLVQNQDEMIKQGRLETPYKGVVDCTLRTFRTEGTV